MHNPFCCHWYLTLYLPEQKTLNWKLWELGNIRLAAHRLAHGVVRPQFDALYSFWQMWGGSVRGKSLLERGQCQIKSNPWSNKVKGCGKYALSGLNTCLITEGNSPVCQSKLIFFDVQWIRSQNGSLRGVQKTFTSFSWAIWVFKLFTLII